MYLLVKSVRRRVRVSVSVRVSVCVCDIVDIFCTFISEPTAKIASVRDRDSIIQREREHLTEVKWCFCTPVSRTLRDWPYTTYFVNRHTMNTEHKTKTTTTTATPTTAPHRHKHRKRWNKKRTTSARAHEIRLVSSYTMSGACARCACVYSSAGKHDIDSIKCAKSEAKHWNIELSVCNRCSLSSPSSLLLLLLFLSAFCFCFSVQLCCAVLCLCYWLLYKYCVYTNASLLWHTVPGFINRI